MDEFGESSINFTDREPEGNFTDTLICAERNINAQDSTLLLYSLALTNTLRAIRVIFFTFVLVSGIFLNSLVIVLVAKFKRLQTFSFGIALQVMVLNLLISLSISLPAVITSLADRWVIGKHICVLTGFVALCTAIMRTVLMLVFVIDRFMNVFFPFSYPKRKVKNAVILSVCSWLLVIVVNIFALPGVLDCYTFNSSSYFCYCSSVCSRGCLLFSGAYIGLVGTPSIVIPVILYGIIFWKAKKLNKATRVAVRDARESEAHKRRQKANITFFLMFLALFVVTLPSNIVSGIIYGVFGHDNLPPVLYSITVIINSFPILLVITDPIFIMRHKDVREVILELKNSLIQRCCSRNHKNY